MQAVLIQWPYPNSFLALQMVASIVVVYTMQLWNLATVRPLQINAAKALLPVVFFYNTNVAFALAAVRALSIPVYHVLKRLTPVMVLIGKFLMGGDPPSKQVTLSVVTVVSGIYLCTYIFLLTVTYVCPSIMLPVAFSHVSITKNIYVVPVTCNSSFCNLFLRSA